MSSGNGRSVETAGRQIRAAIKVAVSPEFNELRLSAEGGRESEGEILSFHCNCISQLLFSHIIAAPFVYVGYAVRHHGRAFVMLIKQTKINPETDRERERKQTLPPAAAGPRRRETQRG